MGCALGLIPAASRVLVDIPVCRCILVAIRGLSRGTTVAILTRRGDTFAARRSLYRSHRPIRGGLMLRVRGVAVLGETELP